MVINLHSPDYVTSLGNCSRDDNSNIRMIESELDAINFDTVKQAYARSLGLNKNIVRSADALLESSDKTTAFLIEFKNGVLIRNSKSKDRKEDDCTKASEIREKARDSLLIYNDLTSTSISDTRENVVFILVYNESKNSLDESLEFIHANVAQKAKTEQIRFKLSCFKGIYFKDVHTYTEAQFIDFLSKEFAT